MKQIKQKVNQYSGKIQFTFSARHPRWLDAWGTVSASSCDAANRKVSRLVSGKAAIFLLLGVLIDAGGIAVHSVLKAYGATVSLWPCLTITMEDPLT